MLRYRRVSAGYLVLLFSPMLWSWKAMVFVWIWRTLTVYFSSRDSFCPRFIQSNSSSRFSCFYRLRYCVVLRFQRKTDSLECVAEERWRHNSSFQVFGWVDATVVETLEKFTVSMYDSKSFHFDVNNVREDIFCSGGRPISTCVPTTASRFQQIKRTAYQAGQLWGCADEFNSMPVPAPVGWG